MPESTPLESTISNEATAQMPALTFEGSIIIVDNEEQIEEACRDLASHAILGFDTETRPSFKAGTSYKVSLLQLSTPNTCYLFRLNKVPFAKPIMQILESDKIVKLGADVAGDVRSLNQLRFFKDRGFIDLQSDIWEWGVTEKSLRKMAAITLGYRISKAQRLSNWEAATLTKQQQQYAATDAWACIEIYNKLQSTPKLSTKQIEAIRKQRAIQAAESAARREAKKAQRKEAWIKRDKPTKTRATKIVKNNNE
ncbi:MAG: 3'-5' exonuclease [Rikenellaceae bacterium]